MQPRLMRSNTERIVAGVCGGLGDYFAIDPVFVRLIFVLVTITSGLGLLIYPALWLAMPKARGALGGVPPQFDVQQFNSNEESYVMHGAARQGQTAPRPAPNAPPYRYDPLTGQPMGETPTTGQTIQLPHESNIVYQAAPQQARPARRGWRFFGFALLGIGVLAFADAIGIDTEIVFPILLIGVGALLLWRR